MRYQDYLNLNELKKYAHQINSCSSGSKITPEMLRSVILESGGMCEWCACRLVDEEFEIDHVIPVSHGGQNNAENLAVACPACNRQKAGKHPGRFAAELVAEKGRITPLTRRVLDFYGIEPQVQQSLFDAPQQQKQIKLDPDDDTEPIPPYVW